MEVIGVIQYGLGPIGAGIARLLSERAGMRLVGAVDIDPAKVGCDIGEVIGLGRPLGIAVRAHLKDVLADTYASAVSLSTSSSLRAVWPQLEECMKAGLDVISTCEELAYPAAQYPELAGWLHRLAEQQGVTVLGTGINPGFAMDVLALLLTGACQHVDSVSVKRVVDASTRRLPLQKKIGAGLSVQEFEERVKAGGVRHVGLTESTAMLAAGLGWSLVKIDETIEPIVATRELQSEHLKVRAGYVAGVHQVARGLIGGREVITLELRMSLQAENPGDFVQIMGTQALEMAVTGIHGDLATAAVVVNSLRRVVEAAPGLSSMKDIAVPSCWEPR
jgi:hypothetical protein